MKYLGSFALPASDGSGSEQGSFSYGGQAMSVTPQGTLLLGGHTWYNSLCEVSIPGIGGTAEVRQRCAEVTGGRIAQVDQDSIEYGGRESLVDIVTAGGVRLHVRSPAAVRVGEPVRASVPVARLLVYREPVA